MRYEDVIERLQKKHGPLVVKNDQPISFKEFTATKFKNECFACKYINASSMRENPKFLALMRIYTDNSSMVSRDNLWLMIKRFYDEYIHGKMPTNALPWSMECIEEHFTEHTRYPTDEILKQIAIKQGIRNQLSNSLIFTNKDNSDKIFNHENIKLLIMLDREIRTILLSRKDISTMVGYCEVLDY